MRTRYTADRQRFIDCANGLLLERNARGEITHLGDGLQNIVDLAQKGKIVVLTVNGEPFSKIVKGKEVRLQYEGKKMGVVK